MSNEPKPSWRTEAGTLANRYALLSGVAVTFVLFGLIVIPSLLRERRAPLPPPSDQPAGASVGWLDQAEAPPAKGKVLPPVDPATVLQPNPKLLARGTALFKQNCSSCHGETGRGDGPAAGTLNPRPRNFTAAEKWTRGFRVTDIFTTVSSGVKGTGMAPYDFILPADRMALVHYVRSLGAFDHGPEDPAALAALSDSLGSKEIRIPNRIPVSQAIAKLVKEQAAIPPVRLPPPSDTSAEAALLRRVVVDAAAAGRTLAATRDRGDRDRVARALATGAPGNGFAPALAGLGAEEWQMLLRALLGAEVPAPASSGKETP